MIILMKKKLAVKLPTVSRIKIAKTCCNVIVLNF